ncbi:metal-dependent transcriptional regulator [Anaerovoracaceae bacterium SGI.195]
MSIQESGEMYLETILVLGQEGDKVRSIDIANYRDVSRASVSRAVGLLKEDNYIDVDEAGYITLTEKGEELATTIYKRHQVLSKIFTEIGVDKEVAVEDACRIEHYISNETFEALRKHFNK